LLLAIASEVQNRIKLKSLNSSTNCIHKAYCPGLDWIQMKLVPPHKCLSDSLNDVDLDYHPETSYSGFVA
jgi:hypothetical protein